MSVTEDAHCMGCRKAWDREVLDSILLTTWLNGEYKTHRENILLDRERSRLPAAQVIIERQKRIEQEFMPIRTALANQITEKEREILVLRQKLWQQMRICEALNRGEDPFANGTAGAEAANVNRQKEERRVFIMPCPASECRGFLSQAYKCGICDNYACPECREIKGKERDAEHTCNPDTVATVQRMKKECRPCPECGANIFKIEGCDQMFCTACNTPFSWASGKKIVTGALHNPHYFEFLRKSNGGAMPRAEGDIPCGAFLPNAYVFDRDIVRLFVKSDEKAVAMKLFHALRTITHIHQVEIRAFTNHADDLDHTFINIQYLKQEITEARWKQLLQQKEKKRLKKDEIRQRLEAYVGTCVDIYGRIMQVAQPSSRTKGNTWLVLQDSLIQLQALHEIFNQSMKEISKRYKCSVMTIEDDTMRLVRTKVTSGRKRILKKKTSDTKDTNPNQDDTESDSSDSEGNNRAANEIVRT